MLHLRFLTPIALLGLGFGSMLLAVGEPQPSTALSQSLSAVSWNGREIIVRGGQQQNVITTNTQAVIQLDGHDITIQGQQLKINGATKTIPTFQSMQINLDGGKLAIQADGQKVWP